MANTIQLDDKVRDKVKAIKKSIEFYPFLFHYGYRNIYCYAFKMYFSFVVMKSMVILPTFCFRV